MDLEDLEVDLDQEGLHYPLHYKLVAAQWIWLLPAGDARGDVS